MNDFDPTFRLDNPSDSVKTIRAKISAWMTSPWLADLVELYEGHIPREGILDDMLANLEVFSDRWDFRRIARERGAQTDDEQRQGSGSARWLSAATGLPQEIELRILDDARHLGLVDACAPVLSDYDHLVALGGARLSCKLRPALAAELIHAGLRVGQVILLGAARPIPDSERDATDTYALGASDEFELIVAGAQQAFGFDAATFDEERNDDPASHNLSWIIRRFRATFDGQPLKILAISAPSSDPLRRRANSADTLLFFLDREKVEPKARLLLITSQIYVPYTQLEALRSIGLPRKVTVETIGFPSERMPSLQGLASANHYLQEVRSTIQAARRFCHAYPEQDL